MEGAVNKLWTVEVSRENTQQISIKRITISKRVQATFIPHGGQPLPH
jgi:hypothetical protein